MPNFMGQNVQTGPYGADQMEIQRRQKLAEMLQQQSMQPIQSQGGGRLQAPISPFQVAGQLMKGYQSKKLSQEAEEKQKTLADRMQSERQAALAKALSQAGGSPQPAPELGGGPAMPGDPMGAAGTLAGSQDPMLAQAGLGMMEQQFKNQMPQQPQPFTLSPGGTRFGPNGQPIASLPPTPPQPPAPAPFTLGQGQQRFGPDGQPIASVPPKPDQPAGGTPYFTPVQTAQGIYAFNARTGQMELVRPGGAPVVGAAADPNLQRNLSAAKATGTVEGQSTAERRFNMQGIGGIIQTADDILSGVKREGGVTVPAAKPTGSGVGAAVDYVGGLVGMSPSGSLQAQQLKALGGALTAKMPRMQGPQSDRDVVLYRQMAAEIGDPTVPIARRKAALDTVKQLWAKYEHLNPEAFTQPAQPQPQGAPQPAGGAPAGVDPAIWNVMTPEEKALWQQ